MDTRERTAWPSPYLPSKRRHEDQLGWSLRRGQTAPEDSCSLASRIAQYNSSVMKIFVHRGKKSEVEKFQTVQQR